MNAIHTPGPWEVHNVEYGDEVTDDLCILSASPEFRDIATIARIHEGDRENEIEAANGRLIAASPYMLSEMQRYLVILERAESHPKIWAFLSEGTGIATANGYRHAIAATEPPA